MGVFSDVGVPSGCSTGTTWAGTGQVIYNYMSGKASSSWAPICVYVEHITASGTTAPPTTTATSTQATTTTLDLIRFFGTITVAGVGLNKTAMETGTKSALATHYNVHSSQITVVATKARRLGASARLLTDTWTITYEFHAATAKATVILAKATADMTNTAPFQEVLRSALVAAGASSSAVNSISVTSFSQTAENPSGTTTTTACNTACGASALVLQILVGVVSAAVHILC